MLFVWIKRLWSESSTMKSYEYNYQQTRQNQIHFRHFEVNRDEYRITKWVIRMLEARLISSQMENTSLRNEHPSAYSFKRNNIYMNKLCQWNSHERDEERDHCKKMGPDTRQIKYGAFVLCEAINKETTPSTNYKNKAIFATTRVVP